MDHFMTDCRSEEKKTITIHGQVSIMSKWNKVFMSSDMH